MADFNKKDGTLETYLVGGAVRDELLKRPVHERDWVVVGATPEEMVDRGFKPIGKDFPVFLHPKTKEEYALARTERKTAKGYKGFEFYTDKNVTLLDDLKRRDLTINAIAKDEKCQLIDPFGGQADIKKKILRHISPAFAEDPVRILRIARFASMLGDFVVANETNELMRSMVESGEVDALVPERIWKELSRALSEPHPERFIEVLRDCGALANIFPEIDALYGVPQTEKWHPEIDTGHHLILTMKMAARLTQDAETRFAVLCHDLGKGTTPKEILPSHHGHEERGARLTKNLCQRIRAPRSFTDLALLVTQYHGRVHTLDEQKPTTLVKLLMKLDPFRKPDRFEKFLVACEADARGRLHHEKDDYREPEKLRDYFNVCATIDIDRIVAETTDEKKIAEKIYQARVNAIKHFRSS